MIIKFNEYFQTPYFPNIVKEVEKDILVNYIAQQLGEKYVGKIKMLGSGAFGTAFELESGKILKLTGDWEEADIANFISTRKYLFKNIINYYDVYKLIIDGDSNYHNTFVLTMDKLEPINKVFPESKISRFHLNRFFNEAQIFIANDRETFTEKHFTGEITLEDFLNEWKRYTECELVPKVENFIREVWSDFKNMKKELNSIGVFWTDLHIDNVGFNPKSNKIVHFDLSGEFEGNYYPIKKMDINSVYDQIKKEQP